MSFGYKRGSIKPDLKRNLQVDSIYSTTPPPTDDPRDLVDDVITSFKQENPVALLTSLDHLAVFLGDNPSLFESPSDITFTSLHSLDLFFTLEFVILQLNDPELVDLGLYIIAALTSIDSFRPSLSTHCKESLVPALLGIATNPAFNDSFRLNSLGTLRNLFLVSTRLCSFAFGTGLLLDAWHLIFNAKDSNPELLVELLTCFVFMLSDLPEPLPPSISHYFTLFLSLLTPDAPWVAEILQLLSLCLSPWPFLALKMIDTPCFDIVKALLVGDSVKVVVQAMTFLRTVLTKCSSEIRASLVGNANEFSERWHEIAKQEKTKIICHWAADTETLLNYNRQMLSDAFVNAGVVGCLLSWATRGCFKIRKASLASFLRLASRFSTEVLKNLVKDGMICEIAEISRELDDEQSVEIVKFLEFLLTVGLDASFIQEVHNELIKSNLVESIQIMMESSEGTVREAATKFHENFLDVSRYLED
jgi:hypothetical protein